MCLHFDVLFTSERSFYIFGGIFWGISMFSVAFIFGAVYIGNELVYNKTWSKFSGTLFIRFKKFLWPKTLFVPALKFTHPLYARTLFIQGPM